LRGSTWQRGGPVTLCRHTVGVVLLLAAAALWSLNGALIKLTSNHGEGPTAVAIAFYRSLLAGLVILPLTRGRWHTLLRRPAVPAPGRRHGKDSVWSRWRRGLATVSGVRPAVVCCVVFFTLMTVLFVVANTRTGAANVIILQYTSTFWIFGLSPWLLGEHPQRSDLWILVLAMVGVGIIFAGNASSELGGLTIALASGFFFGLLSLMIRRMRDSDSAAVTVCNCLGSALLLFPITLLLGGLHIEPRAWPPLAALGVIQFGIPYYLYTVGLSRVRAYQAALITLLEPVLNPVWTYLAVGETFGWSTAAGGGLVLVALVVFLVKRVPSSESLVPSA
ncbi:MAG: DMT family transporter, partial [Phycisphaerae bacterium]